MEMIAKFLRQYLAHNDQAYVPRLGTFHAKNLKADIDPSKKEMKPPVRSVSFKQETSKDNSFIEFLARVDGKSPDTIKKELGKWVDDLKKEIVAKKKVELPGLGHLGVNSAKKVVFKALPNLNISPETLGMQPVKAEVIAAIKEEVKDSEKYSESKKTEEKKEPKIEDKKKDIVAPVAAASDSKSPLEETPKGPVKKEVKKEEEKKNPLVLVLIILVILVVASGIGYYFLSQHKEPVVVEKPEPVAEPEPEPVVEPEPEPQPEPKPVITISEKSGRFYVVGNSFEVEANAYKYRENVMSNGAKDSKIILPDNKSRLYRVSLAEADNLDEAVNKMEDLRADYGNTIWVLIY